MFFEIVCPAAADRRMMVTAPCGLSGRWKEKVYWSSIIALLMMPAQGLDNPNRSSEKFGRE
jgi:hypothetical protein